MPDVYGNPYLPSFVRNQPTMANPVPGVTSPVLPTKVNQITSVQGFAGAHQYAANLANGSSEILAETDQNTPRIYVVVVDQNGQRYVQGFRLTPEEEPKPVTMDDLNSKMYVVLDRLGQLEQERMMRHDKSDFRNAGQGKPVAPNDRRIEGLQRSNGGDQSDGSDRSANAGGAAGN